MFDKALPYPFRIAQAIGISGSIFAFSMSLTSSTIVMPALLYGRDAVLLSKQWRKQYWGGASRAIPLIISSSLAYLYLSYKFYAAHPILFSGEWKVNLLAGLTMVGAGAYTGVAMGGVNGRLLRKAEEFEGLKAEDEVIEVGAAKEESVHGMVDKWATLNLGRAAIFMVSSLAGTYAALG